MEGVWNTPSGIGAGVFHTPYEARPSAPTQGEPGSQGLASGTRRPVPNSR